MIKTASKTCCIVIPLKLNRFYSLNKHVFAKCFFSYKCSYPAGSEINIHQATIMLCFFCLFTYISKGLNQNRHVLKTMLTVWESFWCQLQMYCFCSLLPVCVKSFSTTGTASWCIQVHIGKLRNLVYSGQTRKKELERVSIFSIFLCWNMLAYILLPFLFFQLLHFL